MTIENALNDYRTANDGNHNSNRGFNGVRYAATRADVVAHSQGGQLTRFYISQDTVPMGGINRVGWIANILDNRSEDSAIGRWPYLRSANWGAGSIRRLITLGSPFKGSPWANFASPWLAPGDAGNPSTDPRHVALVGWYEGEFTPPFPPMPWEFANLLFGSPLPPGNYIEPTCVSDLSQGSEAQLALEAATFPSGHRAVRWYPMVGIATESIGDAGGQAVLWELLFTFLPMVPNQPGQFSPLSTANSDLIVPACSQRNLASGCDPNFGPGEQFNYTAHFQINDSNGAEVLAGETTSEPIGEKVAELLSTWPSFFDANWSLGP